jgi:hypothetical protein
MVTTPAPDYRTFFRVPAGLFNMFMGIHRGFCNVAWFTLQNV